MSMRRILIFWVFTFFLSGVNAQITGLFESSSAIRIPFSIKQDFIIVEANIEGLIPMNFIFDTGAENTIIFEKLYTDILGAEYDMRLPIVGSNLKSGDYALVTRNLKFELDNEREFKLDVLVLEEYNQRLKEFLGAEVHGILGSSFFKKYIVEIDYRKQYITLHAPSEFKYSSVRKFTPIDIEVRKGKPYLHTSVLFNPRDTTDITLLMDTGAGINLLIHSNTSESLKIPDSTISGELGVGVGGVLKGHIGRVHEFQFGPISYPGMITSFQDLDSVMIDSIDFYRNGIIGNSLLSRFHIVIDYPSEKLYIQEERGYRDAFKYDRSGLTVIATGPDLNQYMIQSVLPGSPADNAGLKAGDRILKLQCWPGSFYTLGRINRIFKKREGKRIRLKIKRGEEKMRFKFRLRKLI